MCDTGFLGDPLHPNKRLPTFEPQFCWGIELRDKTEFLRERLGRYGLTDFEFHTIFGTYKHSADSPGARAVLHIPEDGRKTLMMDFDRFKYPFFGQVVRGFKLWYTF